MCVTSLGCRPHWKRTKAVLAGLFPMPTIHHGSRQRFDHKRPRQCPDSSSTAQIGPQRVFRRSAGTEQELKAFCQTKIFCQWKTLNKMCNEVIARLLKKLGSISAEIAESIGKSITILQIMAHQYSATFPIFTALFFPSFHFVSPNEPSVWLKSLAKKTGWKEMLALFFLYPFFRTNGQDSEKKRAWKMYSLPPRPLQMGLTLDWAEKREKNLNVSFLFKKEGIFYHFFPGCFDLSCTVVPSLHYSATKSLWCLRYSFCFHPRLSVSSHELVVHARHPPLRNEVGDMLPKGLTRKNTHA